MIQTVRNNCGMRVGIIDKVISKKGTIRGTEENDSPANLLFISVYEWLQSSSPVSRSHSFVECLFYKAFLCLFEQKLTVAQLSLTRT